MNNDISRQIVDALRSVIERLTNHQGRLEKLEERVAMLEVGKNKAEYPSHYLFYDIEKSPISDYVLLKRKREERS